MYILSICMRWIKPRIGYLLKPVSPAIVGWHIKSSHPWAWATRFHTPPLASTSYAVYKQHSNTAPTQDASGGLCVHVAS